MDGGRLSLLTIAFEKATLLRSILLISEQYHLGPPRAGLCTYRRGEVYRLHAGLITRR